MIDNAQNLCARKCPPPTTKDVCTFTHARVWQLRTNKLCPDRALSPTKHTAKVIPWRPFYVRMGFRSKRARVHAHTSESNHMSFHFSCACAYVRVCGCAGTNSASKNEVDVSTHSLNSADGVCYKSIVLCSVRFELITFRVRACSFITLSI